MHIAFQMIFQDCWSVYIFVFVCLSVVMLMMNVSQHICLICLVVIVLTISEAGNQLFVVTNKDVRHSQLGSFYDTIAVKIVFIVK